MTHVVKVNSIKHITHDVLQIVTEKPQKYTFTPGQATEISINKMDAVEILLSRLGIDKSAITKEEI